MVDRDNAKAGFRIFIEKLTAAMLADDMDWLEPHYVLPYAVFTDGQYLRLDDFAVVKSVLGDFAARTRAIGVTKLTADLQQFELQIDNRFHCKVRWTFERPDATREALFEITYFGTTDGTSFKLNMTAIGDTLTAIDQWESVFRHSLNRGTVSDPPIPENVIELADERPAADRPNAPRRTAGDRDIPHPRVGKTDAEQ